MQEISVVMTCKQSQVIDYVAVILPISYQPFSYWTLKTTLLLNACQTYACSKKTFLVYPYFLENGFFSQPLPPHIAILLQYFIC